MKFKLFSILMIFLALSLACQVGTPPVDTEATIAAGIAETQAAQPTTTPPPTETPFPTDTPTEPPTATLTPEPSETPEPPTVTPLPIGAVTSEAAIEGWTRYDFLADAFAISLPESWQQFNTDPETLDAIMSAAGEGNEELEAVLSNQLFQTMMVDGMKFIAIEVSAESLASDLPTTVNILTVELPITVDLDTLATVSMSQLEQIFDLIEPIERKSLLLGPDDLPAEMLISKTNQQDAFGNTIQSVFYQVLILREKTQFVITFATALETEELFAPSFEEIVETFEFLEIP